MMRAMFLAAVVMSTAMHAALFLLPTGPRFATGDSGHVPEIAIEALEPPAPRELLPVPSPPTSVAPREPREKTDRRNTSLQSPNPPAPASPVSTTDTMPHFTIAIGVAPDAYGSVAAAASARPTADIGDAAPISEALVDIRARLLEGRAPTYPEDARAGGVEGDVRLELIVDPDGKVETARVIQGANASLERAALEAVRSFRFDPAKRSGHRVRVRMGWSIEFRLQ